MNMFQKYEHKERDKKMNIVVPVRLHEQLKMLSAKTMKSMNLIIIETLEALIKNK